MNFKNKIILTFFVLLAFILFFNINNVFAFTFTSNVNGNTNEYTLPDLETVGEDYVGFLENGFVIQNYATNMFCLYVLPTNEDFFYGTSGLNMSVACYKFHIDITKNDTWYNKSFSTMKGFLGAGSVIYYGADIYRDESKTELFFQRPPQKVEGITIPALETAEQIPQAIATTLKIMIPVGLIVLSIGFVIYLIKRMRYSTM